MRRVRNDPTPPLRGGGGGLLLHHRPRDACQPTLLLNPSCRQLVEAQFIDDAEEVRHGYAASGACVSMMLTNGADVAEVLLQPQALRILPFHMVHNAAHEIQESRQGREEAVATGRGREQPTSDGLESNRHRRESEDLVRDALDVRGADEALALDAPREGLVEVCQLVEDLKRKVCSPLLPSLHRNVRRRDVLLLLRRRLALCLRGGAPAIW
mmetsp:Transcript_66984/g.188637  ORF Transcript_66984/g.188637 Transcript_66984/m.188637 type:complete len:212 (-) Transcript_66984:869-1504(-)